jgi:hypothetical protein
LGTRPIPASQWGGKSQIPRTPEGIGTFSKSQQNPKHQTPNPKRPRPQRKPAARYPRLPTFPSPGRPTVEPPTGCARKVPARGRCCDASPFPTAISRQLAWVTMNPAYGTQPILAADWCRSLAAGKGRTTQRGGKSQIPSTKSQGNPKHQTPNPKWPGPQGKSAARYPCLPTLPWRGWPIVEPSDSGARKVPVQRPCSRRKSLSRRSFRHVARVTMNPAEPIAASEQPWPFLSGTVCTARGRRLTDRSAPRRDAAHVVHSSLPIRLQSHGGARPPAGCAPGTPGGGNRTRGAIGNELAACQPGRSHYDRAKPSCRDDRPSHRPWVSGLR